MSNDLTTNDSSAPRVPRSRWWIGPAVALVGAVAALAAGGAALTYPSENVVYYGGMVLVGLMAAAALAALTPGAPYRVFAAVFFVAALASVWLLTPPRTIDAAPGRWLAIQFGYEEPERAFFLLNAVEREQYYSHRPTGDLVAALWLGLAAGIAAQTITGLVVARWNLQRKRPRWHQVSLRTLVAYTTAVALLCGAVLQQREAGRREAEAIATLEGLFGRRLAPRYSLFPWMLPWIGRTAEEVSELAVDDEATPAEWEAIKNLHTVSVLELYFPKSSHERAEMQARLRACPLQNVESIWIAAVSFESRDAQWLASFPRLGWLEVVAQESIDFSQLPRFPKLRTVILQGEAKLELSNLDLQPKLREIDVRWTRLSAENIEQIARVESLQEVVFSSVELAPEAFARLPEIAGLNWLTFTSTQHIDDDHVASLARCRDLELLDLSGASVTDAGLSHLRSHGKLNDLSLTNTLVGDEGMSILAGLPKLEWLDLGGTKVTDAGVASLAESRSLGVIRMRSTAVTDKCLEHLARMPSLRELDVLGTHATDEGLRRFAAQRPDVTVHP
jgi:hypothetical protein